MSTRNTKKAERAARDKVRRKIRRKLSAHKATKGSGVKRKTSSHPHRKTSALR